MRYLVAGALFGEAIYIYIYTSMFRGKRNLKRQVARRVAKPSSVTLESNVIMLVFPGRCLTKVEIVTLDTSKDRRFQCYEFNSFVKLSLKTDRKVGFQCHDLRFGAWGGNYPNFG